jgi:hypothetical protein
MFLLLGTFFPLVMMATYGKGLIFLHIGLIIIANFVVLKSIYLTRSTFTSFFQPLPNY